MEQEDYRIPSGAKTTAIDIPDSMAFPKESFLMHPADMEYINHVIIPEGLIKSRCEALAHEIVHSWLK